MKHLKLVHENYFKHMLEAWLIVITFIGAGLICFIHSIFPFLFQTTASTMVKKVINRTDKRQNAND
jgi:hypothetical protein